MNYGVDDAVDVLGHAVGTCASMVGIYYSAKERVVHRLSRCEEAIAIELPI